MRARFVSLMVLCLTVSASSLSAQQIPAQLAPDTIYFNGKIVTVDKPFTIAQAFAVKGERFIAIGNNADIRALAGRNTQLVDLTGHTVIPGLMDNHNHMIWHARDIHRGIDMINVPSLAEMMSRLRQAGSKAKPGEVIVASGGWNARDFPEKRGPNKKDLDDAVPNNPVFLFQSGRNNANLNSAALRELGIDRTTKDWGSFPILRDNETGDPTGELSGGEQVLAADFKLLPQPSVDQQIKWLEEDQQLQHSLGLTGIREISVPVEHMRVYQEMHRQGKLTLRTSMGLMFGVQHVDGWNPVQMDAMLKNFPMAPGMGDDMLQFDGTLGEFEFTTQRVGTLQRKPYPPNSNNVGLGIWKWPHADWFQAIFDAQGNYYGVQRLPTDKVIETVVKMNRYGLRPGFHISGDGALDLHLLAYEAADRDRSIKDKRWAAEHNGGEDDEQMTRLAKLNMIISIQYQDGPMPEWIKHGEMVTSGTDWPAFDNNPFYSMGWYVSRNDPRTGKPVHPEWRISREDALRWATINNAYLMFKEKQTGSIEAGKLADFVILDADVMTVPEEKVKDLHSLATYVGARKVYAKAGGGF
jgi:predicted amidohydrolase YtcJ